MHHFSLYMQALEKQYQDEGVHKITNFNEFVFKGDTTDPHLKIVPSEHDSQIAIIALHPSSAKVYNNLYIER